MDKERVIKLANLARIDIDEQEAESLSHEFGSILNYVGEVKEASAAAGPLAEVDLPLKNVFRDDGESHDSGIYTEKILSQAPSREGDYVKVKNIL